jgi:hypothetical protein
MTDIDADIALQEARLAATLKERELIRAKNGGGAPAELKDEVREARRQYRELRDATPPAEGEARPEAIRATATVQEG